MRISDWSSDVCSSDLVPRTAFPGGLTASFYNSADFSGPVVATRTVKEIDTNWARIDPAPGVDRKTFSVRWQGMLTVPAAGDYLFQLETRRGCDAGGSETYAIRIDGAPDQVFSAPCDEREKIGRAHVSTPVTNAQLVCLLLLETKKPIHHI